MPYSRCTVVSVRFVFDFGIYFKRYNNLAMCRPVFWKLCMHAYHFLSVIYSVILLFATLWGMLHTGWRKLLYLEGQQAIRQLQGIHFIQFEPLYIYDDAAYAYSAIRFSQLDGFFLKLVIMCSNFKYARLIHLGIIDVPKLACGDGLLYCTDTGLRRDGRCVAVGFWAAEWLSRLILFYISMRADQYVFANIHGSDVDELLCHHSLAIQARKSLSFKSCTLFLSPPWQDCINCIWTIILSRPLAMYSSLRYHIAPAVVCRPRDGTIYVAFGVFPSSGSKSQYWTVEILGILKPFCLSSTI